MTPTTTIAPRATTCGADRPYESDLLRLRIWDAAKAGVGQHALCRQIGDVPDLYVCATVEGMIEDGLLVREWGVLRTAGEVLV